MEYVEALWERIAASPDRLPLPDWQVELLDDRLAEAEANPDDTVPWDEVRAEMRAQLRRVK